MNVWRAIRTWALIACAAMLPGLAGAQTTLYVLVEPQSFSICAPPRCVPEPGYLLEIDVERARIRSKTPVPNARSGYSSLASTPDGRYLLWTGAEAIAPGVEPIHLDRLTLFDRMTRRSTEIVRRPPPQECCASSTFNTLLAHPTKVRVFGRLYDPPPFAIDAFVSYPLNAGGQFQQMENLTADGSVLLVRRPDGAVLVDTETGAILAALPGQVSSWAVSPDGTQVYRGFGGPTEQGPATRFARYDALTGALLAERAFVIPIGAFGDSAHTLHIDRRTGYVFAELFSGAVKVLHGDSLEQLGLLTPSLLPPTIPDPEPHPGTSENHMAFDPHGPRAFLLSARRRSVPFSYDSTIDIIDTNTLNVVGAGRLPANGRAADIVVMPRPPAPTGLFAIVSGSRVTLQWTPGAGPGLATGFRIAAGSVPGASNLAVIATTATPMLVVDGVPPGTYHVRVHGTNFEGLSGPSNEVVVKVVP